MKNTTFEDQLRRKPLSRRRQVIGPRITAAFLLIVVKSLRVLHIFIKYFPHIPRNIYCLNLDSPKVQNGSVLINSHNGNIYISRRFSNPVFQSRFCDGNVLLPGEKEFSGIRDDLETFPKTNRACYNDFAIFKDRTYPKRVDHTDFCTVHPRRVMERTKPSLSVMHRLIRHIINRKSKDLTERVFRHSFSPKGSIASFPMLTLHLLPLAQLLVHLFLDAGVFAAQAGDTDRVGGRVLQLRAQVRQAALQLGDGVLQLLQ